MAIYPNHALSHKRQFRVMYTLGIVFLIALIGSGGMYILIDVLPEARSMTKDIIYAIVIMALGLAVPYWMLKLSFHAAHVWNPKEKEFELKDLTKNQDDLVQDKEHAHSRS